MFVPYEVIGIYKPKAHRKAWFIGRALTRRTAAYGLLPHDDDCIKQNKGAAWYSKELHAEVRRTAVLGSEGTSWHQDGDTSPGANMNHILVLWANRDPTELKYNAQIYQPKPYEIVLVRNLDCKHRRPPHVSGLRTSFRQRIKV